MVAAAAAKPSDEAALWAEYRATRSDAARNRLAERYQPFVRRAAHALAHHLPPRLDAEDLVAEGQLGLLRAIAAFDPDNGARFATFAFRFVRGAIVDSIRRDDHVSQQDRRHWKRVDALARDGVPPTADEMVERGGMSRRAAERLAVQGSPPDVVSLASAIHVRRAGGKPLDLADYVADPDAPDPADGIMLRSTFAAARVGMTRAERMVVACYYLEGMTMKEAAEAIGMSERRVSQIHADLIRRMRGNRRLRELCNA